MKLSWLMIEIIKKMVDFQNKIFRWSSERIRNRDIFRKTISLTFRRKESFLSVWGGWVSILIILLIAFIGVFLGIKMLQRTEVQWNQNVYYKNLWNDTTLVPLTDSDKLALKVSIVSSDIVYSGDDIRDVLNISFYHTSRSYQNGYPKIKTENLKFDFWSEYDFIDYKEQRLENNTYDYCFNLTNTQIGGDAYNRDAYEEITVNIDTWKDGNWLNLPLNHAYQLEVYGTIQTLYADLNDLDQILKYKYSVIFNHNLKLIYGKYADKVLVERNEVELEDNWWDIISNPSEFEFNSLSLDSHQESEDGSQIRAQVFVYFSLGDQIHQYRRKVLNFLEVSGILGGIFEIWDLVLGALIGLIYSYLFKRELK